MKEDSNGRQADEAQQQEAGAEEPQTQGEVTAGGAGDDYLALLAKRDERIAELEAQVADAAASKEAAEALRGEIEAVKAAAADERVEYELRLAGARNVTAAKALLAEHGGDVAALKEAEPWDVLGGHAGGGRDGPTKSTPASLQARRFFLAKKRRDRPQFAALAQIAFNELNITCLIPTCFARMPSS